MKTIKQIADELKISKQRVYRYVKQNHITDAHHDTPVMQFDDTVVTLIKRHFQSKTTSGNAHHDVHQTTSNDALIEQLKIKDKQIYTLMKQMENMQILLRIEKESSIKLLEEKKEKKEPFYKRIFKLKP